MAFLTVKEVNDCLNSHRSQRSALASLQSGVRREKFRAAFSFCIIVLYKCLHLSAIYLPLGKTKSWLLGIKATSALQEQGNCSLQSHFHLSVRRVKQSLAAAHRNTALQLTKDLQVSRDFWCSGIEREIPLWAMSAITKIKKQLLCWTLHDQSWKQSVQEQSSEICCKHRNFVFFYWCDKLSFS